MTPKTDVLNSNLLNKLVFCIVLLKALSFGRAFSQSLISNSHFNSTIECPKFWSQKATDFNVSNWYSPTLGTPDSYHTCSVMCGTKSNWLGGAVGSKNEGFIGLVIQSFNKNAEISYREYVQTELSQALLQDSTYILSFDIYFPSKCQFITTDLGFILSDKAIKQQTEGMLTLQQKFPESIPLTRPIVGKWITVSQIYQAEGNERFLTLGNFLYAMSEPTQGLGDIPLSYVFIDNVTLSLTRASQENRKKLETNNVRGITYSIGKIVNVDSNAPDHTSNQKDTAHAYCSCSNCMMMRGELDKSLTKLKSIKDFKVTTNQRIDLNDIIFDITTGAIRPESRPFLNKLIFFLTEIEHADLRFVVCTYESNPNGEAIARETSLNLYHLLRKSGISNTISFLHDTKSSLSRMDGIPTDRSIELHIVKINN